jgi:heptosyltransferase-2
MFSRVSVFSPNWLGDAVMALPALGAIRRHFSASTLVVVARRWLAPLYDAVKGVDEVVVLENGGGIGSAARWKKNIRSVASAGLELAVLLPNSFSTAWLAWRAGIPERWGYRRDGRGRLLTRGVAIPRGSHHQSEYYRLLVAGLGIPADPTHEAIGERLTVPDQVRSAARDLLGRRGCGPGTLLVGMAPGAAYGHAKRWPPDRYASLVAGLADRAGAISIVVGGASDRGAAKEIERSLARRHVAAARQGGRGVRWINLAGQTDLSLLVGVLAECRVLVSNDSGAMHLASACGVPVIAIFGSTNESETSPLAFEEAGRAGVDAPAGERGGARHVIVTNPVWCRPCMLRECPIDHRCMTGIPVSRVAEAVTAELARSAGTKNQA